MNNIMYTIKNNNKVLCARYNDTQFAIGFKNIALARHTQYNLCHMDPITYIGNNQKQSMITIELNDTKIPFHTYVDLYVQKATICTDIVQSPFHLDIIDHDEFLCYPIDKMLGIVIPEEVVEECDSLIVFKSQMVEPCFIPEYYKKILDKQYKY